MVGCAYDIPSVMNKTVRMSQDLGPSNGPDGPGEWPFLLRGGGNAAPSLPVRRALAGSGSGFSSSFLLCPVMPSVDAISGAGGFFGFWDHCLFLAVCWLASWGFWLPGIALCIPSSVRCRRGRRFPPAFFRVARPADNTACRRTELPQCCWILPPPAASK